DTIRTRGGDENPWYERQTPPHAAKNLPLDDVSELRLVRGVTDEIFEILKKHVTVYGEKININKAPIEIIKALLPGLDEDELNDLLELRADQPFSDQADFEKYVQQTLGQTDFNKNPQIPLSGDSEIFEIESDAYVGKAHKTATVTVERGKDTKILSWQIS
ncbi:general secretion pathway protein GspK, partial [Bdellovibrionota bacterium]